MMRCAAILALTRLWAMPASANGTRKLTVFGFLLSQRDVVKEFGIEFKPGRFKKYQTSLTNITEMSGVVFDKSLYDADVMIGESEDVPIVDGSEIKGLRGTAALRPAVDTGAIAARVSSNPASSDVRTKPRS